jgi:DNA modification methylase
VTSTRTEHRRARGRRRGEECGQRPTSAPGGRRLLRGDCIEVLSTIDAESVDAVVCDPPYGIGWQGERWDSSTAIREAAAHLGRGQASRGKAFEIWCALWGEGCLRAMKPGAFLLAFGSPRTHHRLASGLEYAGLEIRDTLIWLHSRGMTKTRRYADLGRTTLKPAVEPILVARKPLDGTTEETIERHGTGYLGTEACQVNGRDPANAIVSHDEVCGEDGCAPGCPVSLLDAAAAGGEGGVGLQLPPSNFLYCPKPSRVERDAGCEELPEQRLSLQPDTGPTSPARNTHPTLKSIDLMRWLVRLACPDGGLVLDPFMGSGTTGVAAALEGRHFCGIEIEERYVEIAVARIEHWRRQAGECTTADPARSGPTDRRGPRPFESRRRR